VNTLPQQIKTIDHYGLYGEKNASDPEFIHIEEIRTRSRLYDWNISAHTHHRMVQLVYIVEGQGQVSLDQSSYELKGRFVVSIPSGVVHAFEFSPDTRGWVLTVSELLLIDARYRRSRKLLEPLVTVPHVLDFSHHHQAVNVFETTLANMTMEFNWPQLGRSFMCDWMTRAVLMTACRHPQVQQSADGSAGSKQDMFRRFRQLVEEHFREHWPVTQYADELAMTPPRLNRLCKSFSDKGAMDLVQDRLVLEAQRHLIYTSATVDMIAAELGFQDSAYFSRFFRRRMGVAPGQFRKAKLAEPFPH